MEFQQVERPVGAFQQPVTAEQVQVMCRRAFGGSTQVISAAELSGGMYDTTYRVKFAAGPDVILRVAPEPSRQSRIERELMRNEHAVQPFLAGLASLWTRRSSPERDMFWTTYGPLSTDSTAARRRLFYRAVHLGAIRLERQRTGRVEGLAETYEAMSEILAGLR